MKLTGQRNQCQGCKEYFNSNKAFDMHRIGTFEGKRRCRDIKEMQKKGMSKNKAGFWITKAYDNTISDLYQTPRIDDLLKGVPQ